MAGMVIICPRNFAPIEEWDLLSCLSLFTVLSAGIESGFRPALSFWLDPVVDADRIQTSEHVLPESVALFVDKIVIAVLVQVEAFGRSGLVVHALPGDHCLLRLHFLDVSRVRP